MLLLNRDDVSEKMCAEDDAYYAQEEAKAKAKVYMRRFLLVRTEDVSGVSGVGTVAEGILFSTGKAVLAWVTRYRSVAIYDSIEELEAIHGHDGRTKIEWIDK